MKVGSWVWMAVIALLFVTLLGGHAVVSTVMPFALLQLVIFAAVLLAGVLLGQQPGVLQTANRMANAASRSSESPFGACPSRASIFRASPIKGSPMTANHSEASVSLSGPAEANPAVADLTAWASLNGEQDAAGSLPLASVALREIEAELHALQDQFRTELRVVGGHDSSSC